MERSVQVRSSSMVGLVASVCRRGQHGRPRFVDDGDNILQFFEYKHLPRTSSGCVKTLWTSCSAHGADVAENEERDVMLRKLLEAKDAGVRALLSK